MLHSRTKPPAAAKRSRLTVSKFAYDRAQHYLAHRQDYRLPRLVRDQLSEVVRGHSGRCDEAAARYGIEWMRVRGRERLQGRDTDFLI
jgi:hypothetical protein